MCRWRDGSIDVVQMYDLRNHRPGGKDVKVATQSAKSTLLIKRTEAGGDLHGLALLLDISVDYPFGCQCRALTEAHTMSRRLACLNRIKRDIEALFNHPRRSLPDPFSGPQGS